MQLLPEVLGLPLMPFRTADLGSSIVRRFVNHERFAGNNPPALTSTGFRVQGVVFDSSPLPQAIGCATRLPALRINDPG